MELTKKELKKAVEEKYVEAWVMVAICFILTLAIALISSDLVSKKLVRMPDVFVLLIIAVAWVTFCARACIKQIKKLQAIVRYVADFKTRDYESIEKISPLVQMSYEENNYKMLRAIKQDLSVKITNHTARTIIDATAIRLLTNGKVRGPIIAFILQALGGH